MFNVEKLSDPDWIAFKDSIIGPTTKKLENGNNEIITRKKTTDVIFDNYRKKHNFNTDEKILLKMINKVFEKIMTPEIVAMQPMTNVVSQIHTLRVRYAKEPKPVAYNGEALSPFDIYKYYAGNEDPEKQNPPQIKRQMPTVICNEITGVSPMVGPKEGRQGHKLSLQILKEAVEASTKKVPGIVDDMTIDEVAEKVAEFIDNRTIEILNRLAEPSFEYDLESGYGGNDSEHYSYYLINLVIQSGNLIAMRTRRGAGNILIVNQDGLDALKKPAYPNSEYIHFVPTTDENRKHRSHVGIYFNSVNVYLNNSVEDIIMLYKGPSEVDSGLFYSPYMIDIKERDLFVRDSLLEMQKTSVSLNNAADYMVKIKIKKKVTKDDIR